MGIIRPISSKYLNVVRFIAEPRQTSSQREMIKEVQLMATWFGCVMMLKG